MRRWSAITAALLCLGGGALAQESGSEMDIVATVQERGGFETLLRAVRAAGLDETLAGEGPYTVFAPTDSAFDALPDGRMDTLMGEENVRELTALLSYHVVPGEMRAGDLDDGQMLETVNGAELEVSRDGDTLTVDGTPIVEPNLQASNGVIHVVDSVLMPDDM